MTQSAMDGSGRSIELSPEDRLAEARKRFPEGEYSDALALELHEIAPENIHWSPDEVRTRAKAKGMRVERPQRIYVGHRSRLAFEVVMSDAPDSLSAHARRAIGGSVAPESWVGIPKAGSNITWIVEIEGDQATFRPYLEHIGGSYAAGRYPNAILVDDIPVQTFTLSEHVVRMPHAPWDGSRPFDPAGEVVEVQRQVFTSGIQAELEQLMAVINAQNGLNLAVTVSRREA